MDELYARLEAELRLRLALIRDDGLRQLDPEAHLQKLKEVSERLEKLGIEISSYCDPKLKHFLERRSYQKVLDFLQAH